MGRYEITSNNKSGYGRYNLAMIPIKSDEKAYFKNNNFENRKV